MHFHCDRLHQVTNKDMNPVVKVTEVIPACYLIFVRCILVRMSSVHFSLYNQPPCIKVLWFWLQPRSIIYSEGWKAMNSKRPIPSNDLGNCVNDVRFVMQENPCLGYWPVSFFIPDFRVLGSRRLQPGFLYLFAVPSTGQVDPSFIHYAHRKTVCKGAVILLIWTKRATTTSICSD